ncbi:MAG: MFS transporter, partial [Actinomycetota bacterium]
GVVLAGAVGWRGLFWINVPLAGVAALAIRRAVPDAGHRGETRMDLVGGIILALSLSTLIVALYNPNPAAGVLPAWGPWTLVAAGGGLVAFVLWERRSPVRLLEAGSVASVPFAAALGTSFLSGVALMVTLVDVPLLAQTLLGKDSFGAALILSRFLIALSVGAVIGGLTARRLGERPVAAAGMAIAAAGYLLIAAWPLDILGAHHVVGPLALRRLDVDLATGGLGLGLIIAPIASVALRSSAPQRHGVAASGVVVTRMMGMLIGIAALAAWGLHRFQELTADLTPPLPFGSSSETHARQLAAYETALTEALRIEYREIFVITAGVCLLGALVALALGRRAREPRDDREAERTAATRFRRRSVGRSATEGPEGKDEQHRTSDGEEQ